MEKPISGEMVRVYSTTSITDGYLARGRLEADGIPVVLKGEGEGPYRMGPVHVLVPSELEVQARLVLDEIREGAARVGEEEDLTAETDWNQGETGPTPE
jgi:hypothetical protein